MKNFTRECVTRAVLKRSPKLCLIGIVLLFMSTFAVAQKPWLHVDGNQIRDPEGNPVTLRGVSVLPNEHNNECNYCNRKPLSEIIAWQADSTRGWYSRIVRLPITTAKVQDPATSFATHIDPFVQQAVALGQYVIVDLQLVANFSYNGSSGIPQSRVMDFWKYVAPRYANNPNVIFEVFNEPISPDCWTCWKEYIQPVVDSIRAVAPNNLIFMGNPQWSTRVNEAVTNPIAGNNIVYVYHLYPNQGAASATNLDAKFGNASQTIPITLTEFGWNSSAEFSNSVTYGTTSGWGQPFREYMDANPQISWQGFIFDNFWKPQVFDYGWNLMSGENQGQFLKDWLYEKRYHQQPGGAFAYPPTAAFTHKTTGLTTNFDATRSSDGNNPIATYTWDFGDGTQGTGITVNHTYAANGTYTVTLTVADSVNTADDQQQIVSVDGQGRSPFTTHVIPGVIQAENYDYGGEGIAYHDTDSVNNGSVYRSNGVDISAPTDSVGGHHVNAIAAGEWLEYSVATITAGTYDIKFRISSSNSSIQTKSITVILGGTILGTVVPGYTGDAYDWGTITLRNVSLAAASNQILRLEFGGGSFSLNYLSFTPSTPPVVPSRLKPWLHVDGNKIKDPQGNLVTLRGVSVLPNEHNNECEYCNRKPLDEIIAWQGDTTRGWYSRVLRLPVTTAKVRNPATSFELHIDPYVQQAIAQNQYVIVDLHYVSNFDYNGSGGITQARVMEFWKYVAPRYANIPNVIFEVFNEPVSPDCWSCWKEYIQPVVDTIRAYAPNNLIFMGSPQWSTRVNEAAADPIAGGNIVYVYHVYPNQGAASTAGLDAKFGTAANTVPVTLTEFGWNSSAEYSNNVTNGTTSGWGQPFRTYMDGHPHISWQGFIFDNFWKPQIFDYNWNIMSGENQGQFMKDWLYQMRNYQQPGGGENYPPTASFTQTASNLTLTLNGSASADVDGTITSYSWDFGDGSAGSGVTVSHTYSGCGTYPVTLTVVDDDNATHTLKRIVTVSAGGSLREAEVQSRWQSGATATVVNDIAAASGGSWVRINSDGVGDFVEYSFTHSGTVVYDVYLRYKAGPDRGNFQMYVNGFAKGSVVDQYSATEHYKEVLLASNVTLYTGQQKLRFTVAGKNASSAGYLLTQDLIHLKVPGSGSCHTPPIASFTASLTGLNATFDASASADYDGTITGYSWDFGDGTTGSGVSASHTYSNCGTYTVALTVTDNDNATHTVQRTISISAGNTIREAEVLSRWQNGATASIINDAAASGGRWTRLNSDGAGDFVEYTIAHSGVVTYDVYLRYKAGPDRGNFQLYANGYAKGPVVDQYSATEQYKEVFLAGNVTLYTGQQKLRLTVAGKNASSSGYMLTQDFINLRATSSGFCQASSSALAPTAKLASEQSDETGVALYPNPASQTVSIDLSYFRDAEVELRILDLVGNPVKAQGIKGGSKYEINISSLRSGSYTVIVKGKGKTVSRKLLIK
ncbi:cellulase family glycosylhydrolase [Fulvivirgaceae bacterium PWU4]|uniref:Cellulase family glycosylhydrolase n=1 Tax=Chryseosolibacter histidini TaxID=2782349 RepID=A0AAP2DLX0_9BACT|nr:cellulase family glycosylhydrolase [Chryseosolibacter histidini]MBT1696389.1 cellulase family glycosylhydrolase [Chryseosolibacter histidini]